MKRVDIENTAILVALTGSTGYGLNRPESDKDYKGIFIASKKYYIGFFTIEQKDSGWDEPGILSFLDNNKDTSLYELKKFIELAKNNNPNILELLWFNEYPHLTDVGRKLIKHKELFTSKKVKHTYSGYSHAQLKKIESHRKWLLDPPERKPTPTDFGIEEEPLTKDNINAFLEYLYSLIRGKIEYLSEAEELYQLLIGDIDYKGLLKQHNLPEDCFEYTQQLTRGSKDYLELLRKSQAYRVAIREWESYLSWQKNRNPARAGMEKAVGYDVKHSVHCIRLLRMGTEILSTGKVIPNRVEAGDAAELRSILAGELTYAEVMQLAKEEEARMEEAYKVSTLQHKPDVSKINDLCIELVEMQGW